MQGGKLTDSYKVSGGLHGLSFCCKRPSEKLELEIDRDEKYFVEFKNEIQKPLNKLENQK